MPERSALPTILAPLLLTYILSPFPVDLCNMREPKLQFCLRKMYGSSPSRPTPPLHPPKKNNPNNKDQKPISTSCDVSRGSTNGKRMLLQGKLWNTKPEFAANKQF